jgi:preprotein translocase subunit SecA
LIIGMTDPQGEALQRACYDWSAQHAPGFVESEHFEYEHDKRQIKLNSAGWKLLRDLPQTSATRSIGIRSLKEYMETAIKARRDFHLDKHYAKIDDKIVIIDEFTGRPAEGRQWQKGLHQAIESKEQVSVTAATRQAATITVQALFKLYPFLGNDRDPWPPGPSFAKSIGGGWRPSRHTNPCAGRSCRR